MITIGPHRLTCGNLTDPQVDEMLAGETVRALNCDPPWGDGNLAYWRTMNKKMTGVEANQISHDKLYDRILELTHRYVRGWLCITTGVRWADQVCRRFEADGLYWIKAYAITYRSGSKIYPCAFLVTSTGEEFGPLTIDPGRFRGYPVVSHVIGALAVPGAIILDPCCGLGMTGRAAVEHGMVFRGNELNQKRLTATMRGLERGFSGNRKRRGSPVVV